MLKTRQLPNLVRVFRFHAFKKIFFLRWQVTILWSHWCSMFWTSVDLGFKARVDPSSPMLCSHLHVMILPQSQLWISKPRPVPVLHLGMVRLPLEWLPKVTSGITGRGKIRIQDLTVQSPMLYRLSYAFHLVLHLKSTHFTHFTWNGSLIASWLVSSTIQMILTNDTDLCISLEM